MWEIENVLLPKHLDAGLRLMGDEDTMALTHNGNAIAHFSNNCTLEGILRTADKYIEETQTK